MRRNLEVHAGPGARGRPANGTVARRLLPVAGLLLLAGCGGRAAPAFVVRDSAGVGIAESRAPAWPAGGGWTLAPDPAVRIGSLDGPPELQFDGVVDALRLPDGRIVVADGGSGEVRFYGSDGAFLRRAGGTGEGPGEFRMISGMGRVGGDSVWVYDYSLRRFTMLPTDGGAPRVVSVGADLPTLVAVGRTSDGGWVMAEAWAARRLAGGGGASGPGGAAQAPRTGLRRDPVAYVRIGPDGMLRDTLGLFPGRELELRIDAEAGRMMMINVPFAHLSSHAMRAGRLFIGDETTFDVGEYRPDGTPVRRLRIPGLDLTLTDDDVQAALQQVLAGLPESARPGIRALWRSYDMPPTRPAYSRLVVDAAGDLWVGEYAHRPATARHWRVFDPEGRWLGVVTVPPDFRITCIDEAGVLGVARDSLDVERVSLFPLDQGG
ncbi:MAG TPA: hypothetical protein VJ957_05370 [Longimicrobiales bacterium]|nr:hypothetical protein [Longimicrobiales bacterium]